VNDADSSRRALRRQLRAQRSALPARARLEAAAAVADRLRQIDAVKSARRVAGYWAVGGELPLHALLAPRPAYDYCLPCLTPDLSLRFAPWLPGDTVHANRYGIPEPELPEAALIEPDAMDVVLVPLLAFDRHGMRLGTGGGYYDRSFAFLQQRERPTRPLLIGIGYAFQEVEMLVAEAWDVRLDFVATEAELIQCTTTSS
jgi:5-formyltetrahydrofolate cyclo-ligase